MIKPRFGTRDITYLLSNFDGTKYDKEGLLDLLQQASRCITRLREVNRKQYKDLLTHKNDKQFTSTKYTI